MESNETHHAQTLAAALDYLLEQTADQDLKYGIELTEGEVEAREQALAALSAYRAEAPDAELV